MAKNKYSIKPMSERATADRMIAEKLAAPGIAKSRDKYIIQCNEDLLRLEVNNINQALSFTFWTLNQNYRFGNKKLGQLMEECSSFLARLQKTFRTSGKPDFVRNYIANWLKKLEKVIHVTFRPLPEEFSVPFIFGGKNEFAEIALSEKWKLTSWQENPLIADWKHDENLKKATPRLVNQARTIVETYNVNVEQKLRRLYGGKTDKHCQFLQNMVLACVCQSLSFSYKWTPEKIKEFTLKIAEMSTLVGTGKDGRVKADGDIITVTEKLKKRTKVDIILPIKREMPIKIGQYDLSFSKENKVIWERQEKEIKDGDLDIASTEKPEAHPALQKKPRKKRSSG